MPDEFDSDYKTWLKKVDSIVIKKCGMSIHDLPDCCFMDWYENDVEPAEAADMVLVQADF